ncbi:MAG: hypothetical protein NTV36_02940 [Candidatus Staskawiczbacteria bacterium]|nr:hypothetical protein [Candidatus Staskawiczbacteria bacterium]
MQKNKYLFLLAFLFVFLFLSAGSAHALEIKYPSVPGLIAPSNSCNGKDCLGIFVAYWFGLLVYIAGIISLVSFTIGAVMLISPVMETHNDAKDRMKGAILGMVLTVASFLIIQTINPSLINPVLTPLPGVAGVFYTNGTEKKPVGLSETNTANRPEGFDSIKYECVPGAESNAPTLFIWEFKRPGLEGGTGNIESAEVKEIACGGTESIGGLGSFRMAFKTPGVYYFLKSGCKGYMSGAITNNENKINTPFNEKLASARIVNSTSVKYGAIFHTQEGLENGGGCTYPITKEDCNSVDIAASSANIFMINQTPALAGDGVDFFSEPYGWNTGSKAGYFPVAKGNISSAYYEDTTKMCFNYKNVDRPDEYKYKCGSNSCGQDAGINECNDTDKKCPNGQVCNNGACGSGKDCNPSLDNCPQVETCGADERCAASGSAQGVDCSKSACETFQDCPGSIDIKGSYLVSVYSEDIQNSMVYCQTFTKSVSNMNTEAFIAEGSEEMGTVYIIPVK